MFISVLIASKGRSAVLCDTLDSIRRQIRQPDEVIIAVTQLSDLPSDVTGCRVVVTDPGVMKQRNAAIAATNEESDVVVFFDDDVELARDYLTQAELFWQARPDVVM